MATIVSTNQLPRVLRQSIAEMIRATLTGVVGHWKVSVLADTQSNAWDVEVTGPDNFNWARRFAGKDRDAEVISEAIHSAILESGRVIEDSMPKGLNEALSSLAIQGIAFTREETPHVPRGETKYIVDRVELKESEIVRLYNQGALTTNGIRCLLLSRAS